MRGGLKGTSLFILGIIYIKALHFAFIIKKYSAHTNSLTSLHFTDITLDTTGAVKKEGAAAEVSYELCPPAPLRPTHLHPIHSPHIRPPSPLPLLPLSPSALNGLPQQHITNANRMYPRLRWRHCEVRGRCDAHSLESRRKGR